MGDVSNSIKLGLLIFALLFLLLTIAGSVLSIFMEHVWSHELTVSAERVEHIKVGLLEACWRVDIKTAKGSWECKSYTEDGMKSPYNGVEITLWCLVGAAAAAGLCTLLVFILFCIHKKSGAKYCVLVAAFFSLCAGAACAVGVVYIEQNRKTAEILPAWVQTKSSNTPSAQMDFAYTFYIICATCGCGFVSGILLTILLFVIWDEKEYREHMGALKVNSRANAYEVDEAKVNEIYDTEHYTMQGQTQGINRKRDFATNNSIKADTDLKISFIEAQRMHSRRVKQENEKGPRMDYQKFLKQQEEQRAYIEEQNRRQYEQQKQKREMRERQLQEEHEQRMLEQQEMIRESSRPGTSMTHPHSDRTDGYSVSNHITYQQQQHPMQQPQQPIPQHHHQQRMPQQQQRQVAPSSTGYQTTGPVTDAYDDYFNSPY